MKYLRKSTHWQERLWDKSDVWHRLWPHANAIYACVLKRKGRTKRYCSQTVHTRIQFPLFSWCCRPDSSNNSLLRRLKRWQPQFILVNAYFSFVYICTYTYTAVFMYDIHVKYYWRWGLERAGNTYEARTEVFFNVICFPNCPPPLCGKNTHVCISGRAPPPCKQVQPSLFCFQKELSILW